MPSSILTSLLPLFLPLLLLISGVIERGDSTPLEEGALTMTPPANFSCFSCNMEHCIEVEMHLQNGNFKPGYYDEKCNFTGPEAPTCFAFYDQTEKRVRQRGCYYRTGNNPDTVKEEHKERRCTRDPESNDNKNGWTLCTCHSESYCNDWTRKEMVLRNGELVSVSRGVYNHNPKVPDFLMEVLIFGLAWRLVGLWDYAS